MKKRNFYISGLLLLLMIAGITSFCKGQSGSDSNAVYRLVLTYKPAIVTLFSNKGLVSKSTVQNTVLVRYQDLQPGYYKAQISWPGQTTVIKDSMWLSEGNNLLIRFEVNGPCLYDHPPDYKPVCTYNHTDSIVPIIYGLIPLNGDEWQGDKKMMKAKYAGCVTTGCDPYFYCKLHDVAF